MLSFLTSLLGTWSILNGGIIAQLYLTYFVLLFGALHASMLHQASGKTLTIDRITYINYAFMVVVIGFLLLIIFLGFDTFGSFFYRVLASLGIIDATLTILAVALHRLYLNNHPEESSPLFTANAHEKRHVSPFLILFGGYLLLQLVFSLIASLR